MSPKRQEQENETLTNTEKKILLGETTFVSVSVVVLIVAAVVYVISLNGRLEAQATTLHSVQNQVSEVKENYKDQTKEYNTTLTDINKRLGRIEGALDIKSEKGK